MGRKFVELTRKSDSTPMIFRINSIDQVYVDEEGRTVVLTSRRESFAVKELYDEVLGILEEADIKALIRRIEELKSRACLCCDDAHPLTY